MCGDKCEYILTAESSCFYFYRLESDISVVHNRNIWIFRGKRVAGEGNNLF